MKQYLLSIHQPDSDPPRPTCLPRSCAMYVRVDEELRPAGAWVFSGGPHAPW
jgi:hypothetical protein